MVAVTFDTLKFVKTLKASGMSAGQAKAMAAAVRDSTNAADLVTRKDLQIDLQKEISPVKADLAAVKADIVPLMWMLGLILAGIVTLVTKALAA